MDMELGDLLCAADVDYLPHKDGLGGVLSVYSSAAVDYFRKIKPRVLEILGESAGSAPPYTPPPDQRNFMSISGVRIGADVAETIHAAVKVKCKAAAQHGLAYAGSYTYDVEFFSAVSASFAMQRVQFVAPTGESYSSPYFFSVVHLRQKLSPGCGW